MKELRIAIIDDNRSSAETIADHLQEREEVEKVLVFTSCEDLLESGQKFDAVITDTQLGPSNMDGFRCTEEIHKRDPHAVIIGTSMMIPGWAGATPQTEEEYRTMYQRLGANDFINRADGVDAIAKRVLELLSTRGPST